jgi:hypothetical protein
VNLPAKAQGYGNIHGTVSDQSGAVVLSATVTVTQVDTGNAFTTFTSKEGTYVFPSLLPKPYKLEVIAPGFQAFSQTGIVLQADQTLTVNVGLQIGSTSQTVSIQADAPQVDTTTGTLSQVIDESRVADLPLNGRNVASLITLVAGVVDATNEGNGVNQGNGKTFPAAVVSSSNGTLPNQNNYLLDGGNNVDEMTNVNGPFPFPDAMQEFSVQTSNYNAEYGQSAGGVVNIVTKSGGNQFHGDAFEFLRNGYFNARPHFATAADNLHRHQFGGTIGGPLIVPLFSHGHSTQFFFGYQHTIYHQNSSANTTTVPTLAEKGLTLTGGLASYADLGNLCTAGWDANNICLSASQTVRNPFTNVAYPLNRIPSSDFDPASVAYEKVFPTYTGTEAPGVIGGAVNYWQPTVQSFNEYVSRVDHSFGANDHLFGRYYYNLFQQDADYNPANYASYRSYFNTRYQNALISETHTFTNNLLNNLVLNYQREVAARGGPPGSPNITAFGVKNIWQPPASDGPFVQATISGYYGANSSAYAFFGRNNYTLNDDLHWVKGAHNIAFGGHYELSKYDVITVYTSYGSFSFNTVTSNKVNGVTYQYPNAVANFLMGFMTGFGQGNYVYMNDRNHFPSVYAQDSWKVTHRLQFNYGVRWEEFAPWANRVGVQTAFSPANYTANVSTSQYSTLPAGMVISGDTGFPKNGVKDQYLQFMPRIGFAYDIFGNGKTAVRGGYGMFYQDRLPGFFNQSQSSFVPNTISVSLTNLGMYGGTAGANPGGPFSDPYCTTTSFCASGGVANPFPFTLPFSSNYTFPNAFQVAEYDPSGKFRVPVTYDYNLTLEQQLTSSSAFRLAYVGSASRHLFVSLEINPAVNNGVGSTNQRRVYNTAPNVGPCTANCKTSYSQIVEAAMIGNAHYNSLQATFDKKIQHGLSLLVNYTWSKAYDDLPQATRLSNTEDLNPGMSYVYPLYPANATGIPSAAYVTDIKALDRGLSDIDHPQALSVSYVYAFPKLSNGNRLLREVVNGWRTSGLIQHHSGDALTVYMNSDNSATGLTQDRGQRDFTKPAYSRDAGGAGKCTAGKSCVNWLNSAAFSVPANTGPGTGFGNIVKDSLRGPGYTDWDGAAIRTFPVYRETNLEFRAEYFDLLNHTLLANPTISNPAASNSNFGTITSTLSSNNMTGARIAQFSLKYTF